MGTQSRWKMEDAAPQSSADAAIQEKLAWAEHAIRNNPEDPEEPAPTLPQPVTLTGARARMIQEASREQSSCASARMESEAHYSHWIRPAYLPMNQVTAEPRIVHTALHRQ